jgi:hypothetical protein
MFSTIRHVLIDLLFLESVVTAIVWYVMYFTRNTPKMFAPPSALCNFFKCAPLTWNPGSAPVD